MDNDYQGYLTFEAKTVLIEMYSQKFGATQTIKNRMYISPEQGSNLIKKYLVNKKCVQMNNNEDLTESVLPMETNSQEFKDFQLLIKSKGQNATLEERVFVKMTALKYKMEDYLINDTNAIVGVGNFLKKALDQLEIKHKTFANYINLKPPNLSKVLNGERKINMEQALIFENIFKINAELWIAIQTKNEILKLEKANRKLFKKYTIKDLIYEG